MGATWLVGSKWPPSTVGWGSRVLLGTKCELGESKDASEGEWSLLAGDILEQELL